MTAVDDVKNTYETFLRIKARILIDVIVSVWPEMFYAETIERHNTH